MAIQAIFLDRDGVINRERADYVKNWQEFEFLPGSLLALRQLAALNLPILVITNQSGIGRGIMTLEMVQTIHQQALQVIQAAGGRIDAFLICPHHPAENCDCRKPKPGLLLQAAAEYNLRLVDCVFIGDSITDFEAAQAVGCGSILVESGRQGAQIRHLLAGRSALAVEESLAGATTFLVDNV